MNTNHNKRFKIVDRRAAWLLALGTAFCALPAAAQTAGSVMIRAGATQINPNVDSGDLSPPSLPGTKASIRSDTRLSGGLTYMVTSNIALDLPLALPFTHEIDGDGAINGVGKIGEVKVLPIRLLGQYRFLAPDSMLRPYAGAGVTYAKTEYGNFTPPFAALFRLPNAQMSFAPEWSASLATTYEHNLGSSMQWRFNVGAKYTSEYNTGSDLNPAKLQDAMTLVNARIGIGGQDRKWFLEAWAQNLTDEEYYQVIFDATLQTGTYDAYLGAPLTYGLTLRVQF